MKDFVEFDDLEGVAKDQEASVQVRAFARFTLIAGPAITDGLNAVREEFGMGACANVGAWLGTIMANIILKAVRKGTIEDRKEALSEFCTDVAMATRDAYNSYERVNGLQ